MLCTLEVSAQLAQNFALNVLVMNLKLLIDIDILVSFYWKNEIKMLQHLCWLKQQEENYGQLFQNLSHSEMLDIMFLVKCINHM